MDYREKKERKEKKKHRLEKEFSNIEVSFPFFFFFSSFANYRIGKKKREREKDGIRGETLPLGRVFVFWDVAREKNDKGREESACVARESSTRSKWENNRERMPDGSLLSRVAFALHSIPHQESAHASASLADVHPHPLFLSISTIFPSFASTRSSTLPKVLGSETQFLFIRIPTSSTFSRCPFTMYPRLPCLYFSIFVS